MAHISLASQTTLQNPANFFGFALYDASAPFVLLENQIPDKPYGNPIDVEFNYNAINGHVYIIRLWESPAGTPDGLLRNIFAREVDGSSVLVRKMLYLQEGITPGLNSGSDTYTDDTLTGWDYVLFRNPYILIPDESDNTPPDYHKNTNGWTLLSTTIEKNERFEMLFEAQVISIPPGMPSNLFSSGRVITFNETLTGDDLNKELSLQSGDIALDLILPSLVGVSDYSFLYFFSNGGIHKNVSLIAPGTDKIFFNGDKSRIILGQQENAAFYKARGKWQTMGDLFGVRTVGEIFLSANTEEINALPCIGQLVGRTNYPRLWAWIQTLASGIVSDAVWASFSTYNGQTVYRNRSYFSTGDGSTNFRIPDLTDRIVQGLFTPVSTPGAGQIILSASFDSSKPNILTYGSNIFIRY